MDRDNDYISGSELNTIPEFESGGLDAFRNAKPRDYNLPLSDIKRQFNITNETLQIWAQRPEAGFWTKVGQGFVRAGQGISDIGQNLRNFTVRHMMPDSNEEEARTIIEAGLRRQINRNNYRSAHEQYIETADSVITDIAAGFATAGAFALTALGASLVGAPVAAIVGVVAGLQEGLGKAEEWAESYAEESGDYSLQNYNKTNDIYAIAHGALSGWIESKLGVERLIGGAVVKTGAKRALRQGILGAAGEGAEEFLQEGSGWILGKFTGQERRNAEQMLNDATINAIYGAIVGGVMGTGMYYVNRQKLTNLFKAVGIPEARAKELAIQTIEEGKIPVVNEIKTIIELENYFGDSFNSLVDKIDSGLLDAGWEDSVIDPNTNISRPRREYAKTVAEDIARQVLRQAEINHITVDEQLKLADIEVIRNIVYLKPQDLGTAQEISSRIKEKKAELKEQNQLTRLGAGNTERKANLRLQIAVLQQLLERRNYSERAEARARNNTKAQNDQVVLENTMPDTIAALDNVPVVDENYAGDFVYVGNKRLPVSYKAVEVENVIPSHINGTVNPQYTLKELQNRASRGTTADTAVLQERAMHIHPEELLKSPSTQSGAPLVNEQGEVIAGNGRYEIVRRAYDLGKTKGYRRAIEKIDPSAKGMKKPILVREIKGLSPEQQIAVADASNVSSISEFDRASRAKQDAKLLKGTSDIMEFANKIPLSNRQGLFLNNGNWDMVALRRRYNDAMLMWMCGNDTNTFESLVLMGKLSSKVISALTQLAPAIYAFQTENPTLDLRGDIEGAIKRLPSISKRADFAVDISTPTFDAENLFAQNVLLYNFMFGNNNEIATFFDKYIEKAAANNQPGLFPENTFSKNDLYNQTLQDTYPSGFDESGTATDRNIKAVILSMNNETTAPQEQNTSFQEQLDLANENARLDDIYPEYKGETIDIFDYDTTSISDWADKNIEKQDSFETDEGVFTNYKLVGDNRKMPTFTVFESKDGWIVRKADIPESEQNKGIGTKFYQYINLKSIEKTGKPLRSTQPKKLSSGIEVFELSYLGHKLWYSLTKKGLAVRNKNGTYEFKKPQERTVYNSNGDRIAKSEPALRNFYKWFGDSKVVDEQGRPLVVYHGSDVSGIEVFDNQANQTKQGIPDIDTAGFDIEQYQYKSGTARVPGNGFIEFRTDGAMLYVDNIFVAEKRRGYASTALKLLVREHPEIQTVKAEITNKQAYALFEKVFGAPNEAIDINKLSDDWSDYKDRDGETFELTYNTRRNAEIIEPNKAQINYSGFRKPIKDILKIKAVNDWVANVHKNPNLNFTTIPSIYSLDVKNLIHKSPTYHRSQSSEYYVGIYKGKPVYVRKSNHWGRFSTNLTVDNATVQQKIGFLRERNELNDIPESHIVTPNLLTEQEVNKIDERFAQYGDQFGRVGFNFFDWELQGGQRRKDGDYANVSQVGIIEIPQELFGAGSTVGTELNTTTDILSQGRIQNGFYDAELNVIVLGRNFNTGTLPHEMAHFWLNEIFTQAKSNKEWTPEFTKQANALFNMLGIDDKQTRLTVEQQERFARMTEAVIFGLATPPEGTQLPITAYLNWIPPKYESILDLQYKGDDGRYHTPILDKAAVEFFNAWYSNPKLPPITTSPARMANTNFEDKDGEVVPSAPEVIKARETEQEQEIKDQQQVDNAMFADAYESTPADTRAKMAGYDLMVSRNAKMPEPVSTAPVRESFLKPGRGRNTQQGMINAVEKYLKKNRDHAEEVAFGSPNPADPLYVFNDTGLERGRLIRGVMEFYKKGSDEYAQLYDNFVVDRSLAGKAGGLNNDVNTQFYSDGRTMLSLAMETRAAIKYAGTKRGALEKFNADIDAFVRARAKEILATTPNTSERNNLIDAMIREAEIKFAGDIGDSRILYQENKMGQRATARQQEMFIAWAKREIRKMLKADPNPEQISKLITLSEKAQEAQKDLDNPDADTAVAAAKVIRDWQEFVRSENLPDSVWAKLIGSWFPRAMLMNINTHTVNLTSNTVNLGMIKLALRAQFAKTGQKVDKRVMDAEKQRIKAIYDATLMNFAQMEKPTSPSVLHGEKIEINGENGTVLDNIKKFDTLKLLGKEDFFFRSNVYVEALGYIASKNAAQNGRNPNDLFREYAKINQVKDSEAEAARKQALQIANIAVFTQNGVLARALGDMRRALNRLTGNENAGLGNIIAPFVKTPANIVELGARAAFAPISDLIYLGRRAYSAINPNAKVVPTWNFENTLSNIYFGVGLILMAALTGDYEPPYESPQKYNPQKPYDSFRFAGTNAWVKLDLLGAMAIPARFLLTLMYGKGSAIRGTLNDVPLIGDAVETYNSLERSSTSGEKALKFGINFGYNQANKAVPAIAKQVMNLANLADYDLETLDFNLGFNTGIGRKIGRQYGLDAETRTETEFWNDVLAVIFNRLKLTQE